MTENKLKLNSAKTEFFLAASAYNLIYLKDICIDIGGTVISQSSTIRNLGVVFDKKISMSNHVSNLVKTVNYHLRNISRIRRYITPESCHALARSLVLSRLDYANSTMYGITCKDMQKLQSLQNKAARIVFRVDRMHPTAPLLKQLHWLPVESWIIYKLMLLTYKGTHGHLPTYLSDHLIPYVPGKPGLRSGDDKTRLDIPDTDYTHGDKAFSAIAPRLWNSLPVNIRSCPSITRFRKLLKTHLFPSD